MLYKLKGLYTLFYLFLKEIQFLKTYLLRLFFLMLLVNGCSGNKNKEPGIKQRSIKSKDNEPIDFAAGGLENMNASRVMKDIICQTWEFKEDVKDAVDADPSTGLELIYRGYCLFSDGSMIKDPRGNMQVGKWIMNDQVKPITIKFNFTNGEIEFYQLAYLMPYEMKLARMDGEKKMVIDLASEAIRHIDQKEDPFSVSNNVWRFKPSRPESDEQIKARLKSCIHFFVLFYDQKIHAGSEAVSFVGLPSCFKWYGGGIFLQKKNELQSKWINTFYNKEQAMKAYELAEKLMNHKYSWSKKEANWLKLNVAVLQQMESRMDAL